MPTDSQLFVPSTDSLFGQEIETKDALLFCKKPPLVLGAKNDKQSLKSVSTSHVLHCYTTSTWTKMFN